MHTKLATQKPNIPFGPHDKRQCVYWLDLMSHLVTLWGLHHTTSIMVIGQWINVHFSVELAKITKRDISQNFTITRIKLHSREKWDNPLCWPWTVRGSICQKYCLTFNQEHNFAILLLVLVWFWYMFRFGTFYSIFQHV